MKAQDTRAGGRHCYHMRAEAGEAEPEAGSALEGRNLADAPALAPLESLVRWARPCKLEMIRFLRGEES